MNLQNYIKVLEELDNYSEETFKTNIKITVSKNTMVNYQIKNDASEQEDYLKRLLLTYYFPECFSLKILQHNIYPVGTENIFYCEIELNTNEYKECISKCLDHFFLNPSWRVVNLRPIRKEWHIGGSV